MTELKPCPFAKCGGKAKLISNGKEFWIRCKKCETATYAFNTKQEAIDFWNDRKEEKNV